MVVDHRPGGNSIIGCEALVRSAPDGHTILVVNSAHIINAQGMEPFISSPAQFAALMKADMVKFARIVKAANIQQID